MAIGVAGQLGQPGERALLDRLGGALVCMRAQLVPLLLIGLLTNGLGLGLAQLVRVLPWHGPGLDTLYGCVGLVLSLLVGTVGAGAVAFLVAETYAGRAAGGIETARALRPHLAALLLWPALAVWRVRSLRFVLVAAIIVVAVLASVWGAPIGSRYGAVVLNLITLALLACALVGVVVVWRAVARLSMTAPAIVVEGRTAAEGIERSWELTDERSLWIIGSYLLLSLPLGLIFWPAAALLGAGPAYPLLVGLVGLVYGPFFAVYTTLMYYDSRW